MREPPQSGDWEVSEQRKCLYPVLDLFFSVLVCLRGARHDSDRAISEVLSLCTRRDKRRFRHKSALEILTFYPVLGVRSGISLPVCDSPHSSISVFPGLQKEVSLPCSRPSFSGFARWAWQLFQTPSLCTRGRLRNSPSCAWRRSRLRQALVLPRHQTPA